MLVDGEVRLWGSNLVIEYLLATYPENPVDAPDPPLAAAMTRPDQHWTDALTLATIETLTDSIMNLRQLKLSGQEPAQVPYLRRQRERIDRCLDWLNQRAGPGGFAPGLFSIMDLNLICALGNIDNHKSFEWRGRSHLEGVVARYAERPSVSSTAHE